jgi:Sulfatase
MLRSIWALGPALLSAFCFSPPARAEPLRSNIIFIMADDLGNADLGYRGGEVKPPNIDKLAADAVRLECFYGEPVCTPSGSADDRSLSRPPIR